MRVHVVPCGPPANESELRAVNYLKQHLQGLAGDDEWFLLTNLAFSVTHQFQSDEIDIVAIGPPGVRVLEVKHWRPSWIQETVDVVEREADKLTNKARKIGTTLRRIAPDLPRVDGQFLLTRSEPTSTEAVNHQVIRGVRVCMLSQWQDACGLEERACLKREQIRAIAKALYPKSAVAADGSLRRLAGYVNLELQSPKDQRLHRIYRGSHPARRDRVILHLYDLSADQDKKSETRAEREWEALQRLQFYSWAPRILDSYQEAPGYAGEMNFFTIVDPAAPTLRERAEDETWTTENRLQFAREVIQAVREMHEVDAGDTPLVHRRLTPETILVRHDNSPILTGFDRTRIASRTSVASSSMLATEFPELMAPEVRDQGLTAADQRSDVYSVCASLCVLFTGRTDDHLRQATTDVLGRGMTDVPAKRISLSDLHTALGELVGDSEARPPAPPVRFWSEDQVIRFKDHDYRIVARLGSGGVGTAFKVIGVDRSTQEDLGTYVAKVAHEGDTGQRVLRAYQLVRPRLGRHESLSPIYEIARLWQENQFIALMGWIDGTPLSEFTGVFPLLAEDQGDLSTDALVLRWLAQCCEALDVLHSNGLIHGDVSPKNMIVCGSTIVRRRGQDLYLNPSASWKIETASGSTTSNLKGQLSRFKE